EYAPNFNADGSKITYVTWSDEEKGAVWIANADGSKAQKITTVGDQYANPVFSPDGTKVAYLKGRGSSYHEEDLAEESNLEIHYWDGREHHYVIDLFNRGTNARMPTLAFDTKGERIFFMESKPAQGGVNTYLSSAKLTGDDYRQHIESKYAA